jgi:hypothetical protein
VTKPRNRLDLAGAAALVAPICGDVEWREAVDFSNHYVSSGGHVWSCRSQKLVVGCIAGAGYRQIRRKAVPSEYVHRIVCRTFHGRPTPPRDHVRHLDGDPTNNRADNLAWGSRAENQADKERHGRVLRGDRCPASTLTRVQVEELRAIHARGEASYTQLAQRYGVSSTTIGRAVTGETWA